MDCVIGPSDKLALPAAPKPGVFGEKVGVPVKVTAGNTYVPLFLFTPKYLIADFQIAKRNDVVRHGRRKIQVGQTRAGHFNIVRHRRGAAAGCGIANLEFGVTAVGGVVIAARYHHDFASAHGTERTWLSRLQFEFDFVSHGNGAAVIARAGAV